MLGVTFSLLASGFLPGTSGDWIRWRNSLTLRFEAPFPQGRTGPGRAGGLNSHHSFFGALAAGDFFVARQL